MDDVVDIQCSSGFDLDKPVIEKHFCTPTTFNNPAKWELWRKPGLGEFAMMKLKVPNRAGVPHDNEEELQKHLPVHNVDKDDEAKHKLHKPPENGMQIMWIGHATLLIQFDGLNILTDPVFQDRCSPVQLAGPKRYRPVPCSIANLPPIDAVLISHNHYDHLEHDAVEKLNKRFGDKIRWFVPLNMRDWFIGYGCSNVREMTWWQKNTYNPDANGSKSEESKRIADVICVPAQHWSQRGPFDAMQSLWCGWVVKTKKGHTFYYTGDTGYCPVFKQIGERFGPMDLTAIPIGCYAPKYFMEPQHIGPEEAVMIHNEVRSRRSVGIHWGTFDGLGSHEHYLEPKKILVEAVQNLKEKTDEFFTVDHGKIQFIQYTEDKDSEHGKPSNL